MKLNTNSGNIEASTNGGALVKSGAEFGVIKYPIMVMPNPQMSIIIGAIMEIAARDFRSLNAVKSSLR